MKTIRDFINLVEQDIDPSTVVLDPRPAATPADVSGLENRVQVINGRKVVVLTDQEEANIRKLFERIDTLLSHYPDKDGKTFESVDFESTTESEQRQYIMQNLHLLSEADQMVVLRDLMNEESIGKAAARAAYNDIIKPGIQGGGQMVKKGIENLGDLAKKGIEGLGGLTADALRGSGATANTLAKWAALGILAPVVVTGAGAIGYFAWHAPWDRLFKAIFPTDQEVLTQLSAQDQKEFESIENDWNNLISVPSKYLFDKNIEYRFSAALNGDIARYAARWEAFVKDMAKIKTAPPPAPLPPMKQRVLDVFKF